MIIYFIYFLAFVVGLFTIWLYDLLEAHIQNILLLFIYFLCPIVVSIIYWFEEPVPFSLDMDDVLIRLIHNIASILGVCSYLWMCFNILIMIKISSIEKMINLDWLIKFHKEMAVISLLSGFTHALMLFLTGEIPDKQWITGTIGFLIFFILIVFATIFMTNWLINSKKIRKLREVAYRKKFKYSVNKALHNVTMLTVFFIFIHTLVSSTATSSMFMRGVYFSFFVITLIGWVAHKLIRRLRLETDPYAYRKGSWDISTPEIFHASIKHWALKIIKEQPSIYPCLQCGTCTLNCPVSNISKGRYNPRSNILNILLGYKDAIFSGDLLSIWGCTLCDTCDVVCPQNIEVTEVLTLLKNESVRRGDAPDVIYGQAGAVFETGKAIPPQPSIERRRKSMGLPTVPEPDVHEVQTLLKNIGVNKKLKL